MVGFLVWAQGGMGEALHDSLICPAIGSVIVLVTFGLWCWALCKPRPKVRVGIKWGLVVSATIVSLAWVGLTIGVMTGPGPRQYGDGERLEELPEIKVLDPSFDFHYVDWDNHSTTIDVDGVNASTHQPLQARFRVGSQIEVWNPSARQWVSLQQWRATTRPGGFP